VFLAISLTLPTRAKLVRELLVGVMGFFLDAGGFREADHEFATPSPPAVFQHLPDYAAWALCTVFGFLFRYGIIKAQPDLEMRLLAHLFSDDCYLKNSVHRLAVVRFYASVAMAPSSSTWSSC
jgi:hypothetical protein